MKVLTLLQNCSFADLLCGHGEVRLLLACRHYRLQVIIAFLWDRDPNRHF